MYLSARGWDIQPGEFWNMTLGEFLVEFEHRRPRDPENDYAGSLTRADVDELRAWDEETDGPS